MYTQCKKTAWTTAMLLLPSLCVFAQSPPPPPASDPAAASADAVKPFLASGQPKVEKIADGVFRIGSITLYRQERRFVVPGRIIRLERPLEFLAITKGGHKAYESLIELDTDAYMFNLACILIGLEPGSRAPEFHFDERPVEGPQVHLTVSWGTEGNRKEVAPEQLMVNNGKPVDKATWIYTGSSFVDPGQIYMAQQDGTLIGFVHDPASIIEHKTGIGFNDYGAIDGNPDIAPSVGTPIELTVAVPGG